MSDLTIQRSQCSCSVGFLSRCLILSSLGWETIESNINTPVGYEGTGYGYRDVDGSKIHKGKREDYGKSFSIHFSPPFHLRIETGDVVGMLISFPGLNEVGILGNE